MVQYNYMLSQLSIFKLISQQEMDAIKNRLDLSELKLSLIKEDKKFQIKINGYDFMLVTDDMSYFNYPFSYFFVQADIEYIRTTFLEKQSEYNYYISGKKSRKAGDKFEMQIVSMLNAAGNFRDKFVESVFKFFPEITNFENCSLTFERHGSSKVPDVFGKKTTRKSDIQLTIKDVFTNQILKKVQFSLKKTNTRTQIHVSSPTKFLEYFKVRNVPISSTLETAIFKFCGCINYAPAELNPMETPEELRLKYSQFDRNRYLLNELTEDEQKVMLDWFSTYQRDILKLILSSGYCQNPEDWAHLYLTNPSSWSEGDEIKELNLESIDDIIYNCPDPVKFSSQFGCLKLGMGIDMQMKGSGQTRTARSNLQFQKKSE